MNKVQQKFEEWANVEGLRLERQKTMCGGDMGRYEFGPTQAAFEVWIDAWTESRKAIVVKLHDSYYDGSSDDYCLGYEAAIFEVQRKLDHAGVKYE